MLSCREVNEQCTDYLERQLTWRGRLAVRAHLLICSYCRRFLRQLALTRATLQRLRPPANEAAVRRIRQAIDALPQEPPPP